MRIFEIFILLLSVFHTHLVNNILVDPPNKIVCFQSAVCQKTKNRASSTLFMWKILKPAIFRHLVDILHIQGFIKGT